MAKLELDKPEIQSAAWQKVEAYLKAQLAELREANDQNLDVEKTAKLRGRISQVNDMLNQVNREQPEFKPVSHQIPV